MIRVNKQLVHKQREENAFVYNMRRKLPRKIDRNIFENFILPSIGEKNREKLKRSFIQKNLEFVFDGEAECMLNKDIFMSHYIKTKKKFEEVFDQHVFASIQEKEKKFLCTYYKPLIKHCYVFCEAPFRIEAEKFMSLTKDMQKADSDFLQECYLFDKERNRYLLKDSVSEIDEEKIISLVDDHNLCINDHDRAHLSDLLDDYTSLEREYEFFANLEVDTRHFFFFEHPNEHVPGMLIIEGVRQFLLACSHKYGNIPLSGVTIVLQNLSAQFNEYMELHTSIRIRSTGNEVKYNRHDYWSLYDTDVEVYQKKKLKGTIKVRAVSIKNKLFKRFRQQSIDTDKQARFIPRDTFSAPFVLDSAGKQILCKVKNISHSGFCLSLNHDTAIDINSTYHFYVCLQNIGLVHGECRCVRKEFDNESDEQAGGFYITSMEKENQSNFTELIKCYCLLNRDRELYEKKRMYNA